MPSAASNPDVGLINWPALSVGSYQDPVGAGEWRDTGEGGLFVFALWGMPPQRCIVDAHLSIGPWDVEVALVGPLAADLNAGMRTWTQRSSERAEHRYDSGPTLTRSDADRLFDDAVHSGIGASLFLGSTPHSLFSDHLGDYFSVRGVTDLTPAGIALVGSMEAVYGPVTYATFLDT